MISALIPFLLNSPPTPATHNPPWLGATAENATLTLSAAATGLGKTFASRTLNPRTSNFLLPDRTRRQNIMASEDFLFAVQLAKIFHSRGCADDSRVNQQRQA